jgi:hypothetical protein
MATPAQLARMGQAILNFEARRDSRGRLAFRRGCDAVPAGEGTATRAYPASKHLLDHSRSVWLPSASEVTLRG